MISRKYLIIILLVIVGVVWVVMRNFIGDKGLTSSNAVFSENNSTSPTITPTPIIFDKGSNLEEEIENLTPEDFGNDFKNLRDGVSSL